MQNRSRIDNKMVTNTALEEEYRLVGDDNVSIDIIYKHLYKMRKYGVWIKGKDKLNEMHRHMLKQGRSKIEEVGVRIYCTQIAKIYGVTENTARKDYSDLVKYGRL